MRKILKTLLIIAIIIIGGTIGYKEYQDYLKHIADRDYYFMLCEKRMDPKSLIDDYIAAKKEEERINREYGEYLFAQWSTPEYKEWKYVRNLKDAYGINTYGYRKYTMELSFYSDLNCENGYGNLTATGEILSPGMVANNQLPFGTKVYMEKGYGMKTVKDRGSHRYFGNVTKFDVFVPRKSGESDGAYYRRVNNMGRVNVTGYIFD